MQHPGPARTRGHATLAAALAVFSVGWNACDRGPSAPWTPPSHWASPLAPARPAIELPGLADLTGDAHRSDAQLHDALAAIAKSTHGKFVPFGFDPAIDHHEKSQQQLAAGWAANGVAPLPLQGPVAWGTARGDDPNWHYQLNAFRPWEPCVLAAFANSDGPELDVALAAARDWIAFNLLQDGANEKKWYDMGAGLRAHAFAVLLHALLRRERADPDLVRLLVWALHEHGRVLTQPELLPEGNHALFMMLGVHAVCAVVPLFPESGAWRRYADAGVAAYLAETVSPEGISLEHSPSYHWFVAATLRDFDRTRLFPAGAAATTEQLLAQTVWMLHPNGTMVNIGDSEGVGRRGYHAFTDFALSGGDQGSAPPDAPQAFPIAGVAVLRDRWNERPLAQHDYVQLRAAQHSTVHKHADDGTFEWSCKGRVVIQDSGKFTYRRTPERAFFAGTRAANTIEIDGADLPVAARKAYGSGLTEVGRTPGGVQHAACRVPREHGVEHRRVVVMGDGWLVVADDLRGDRPHTYRQWLGFHEDFALQAGTAERLAGAERLVLAPEHGDAITVTALADGTFEKARGETAPMNGWVSHRYQERVPRWSVATVHTGEHVRLATLLASPGVTLTAASYEADALHVVIDDARGSHHLALRVAADHGCVTERPARPH